jgi:hypothetical protein
MSTVTLPLADKKSKSSELVCPECLAKGEKRVFQSNQGLASHRSRSHDVKGTANSTLNWRKNHLKANKKTKAAKEVTSTRTVNPKSVALVAPQRAVSDISNAIVVGYAIGKVETLAKDIARQNNLSEKEFVEQVAVGFARITQK